jgi:hypothetical protein
VTSSEPFKAEMVLSGFPEKLKPGDYSVLLHDVMVGDDGTLYFAITPSELSSSSQ